MSNDEPAREPVKEDARIDALEARLAAAQQRAEVETLSRVPEGPEYQAPLGLQPGRRLGG